MMIVFSAENGTDEDRFADWLNNNNNGFVLNCHRIPKATYLKVHKAPCQTLQRKQNYVSNRYIKICTNDRSDLKRWVESQNLDPKALSECRRCFSVSEPVFHSFEDAVASFEKCVAAARGLTLDQLRSHLPDAGRPLTKTLPITIRVRSPYVVAFVEKRANGKCERCKSCAPFSRPDGTPYLEVHHKIRLADGGEDTVGNAQAVCPNCHRELHYGSDSGVPVI